MNAAALPELRSLFVLDADAAAGRTPLLSGDDPGAIAGSCRTAAKALAAGDRLLITFGLAAGGPLQRAARLLLLPLRLARLDRELARHGCSTSHYAVTPTLASPSLVIELGSTAAAYSHTHLLNHGARLRRVRAMLHWWLSCDPSTGGIVVVARR